MPSIDLVNHQQFKAEENVSTVDNNEDDFSPFSSKDDFVDNREKNTKNALLSTISSTRFTLACMGFLGFLLVNAMRVNISVALVDMVDDSSEDDNSTSNENCPISTSKNDSNNQQSGTFDWTTSQQATVLGAFYYGYTVTQIPAGILARRYGGKLFFGLGILLSGIFTLLTPLASHLGVYWLIALRILEGMTEAVTSPAFNHLMGLWAPKYERSSFSAFVYSGSTLGNVITNPIVGYLCTVPLWDGWPLGFYVNGALTLMWYVFWCVIISETPEEHPRISDEEKRHIKAGISETQKPLSIPWREMLTCRAFYGLLICHFSCNFQFYGLMSLLPQYLSNVLNFDISSNGFLTSLPWLCSWISTWVICGVTDYLRGQKYISTTAIRKINAFVGSLFPGLFLVLAGYAECNATVAITFIVLAMVFFGANWSGYNCNNLDIAPNFAGVLYSITNTFATVPGFIAPILVEWITHDNIHSEELWRYSFYLFAAVSWFGGLMFILLASGEVQSWAIVEKQIVTETELSVDSDEG
ncbi:sialin-like [Convolutriloba macropyga]|uniref:sialin-like n=1 Tax=Convolutriloba macropyga TaxID=536237 RepID=UPI003F523BF7